MDWAKTSARQDKKHLSFGVTYVRGFMISYLPIFFRVTSLAPDRGNIIINMTLTFDIAYDFVLDFDSECRDWLSSGDIRQVDILAIGNPVSIDNCINKYQFIQERR